MVLFCKTDEKGKERKYEKDVVAGYGAGGESGRMYGDEYGKF